MRRALLALGVTVCLSGCPAVHEEPPPPPSKPEIAVAAPHALGALAAGTDAAPRPEMSLGDSEAEPDALPSPAEPPSGGGGAKPEAPSPTPALPDAGVAL